MTGGEQQQDLVAGAWAGAKLSGSVQSLLDAIRREVETFFTAMELTNNIVDDTKPVAAGAEGTYCMVESLWSFINNDIAKA